VGTINVFHADDQVIVNVLESIFSELSVKVLNFKETSTDVFQYNFADFKSRTFKDWVQEDGGINYQSFLETGHDLLEDPITIKYGNYLYAFFLRTEDGFDDDLNAMNQSSCLYRAKWHWSDSEASGKWSQQEQLYKLSRPFLPASVNDPFDYGFEVIETRSKMRGEGRALSIRFDSEEGKDFKLLGWAIPFTGAAR